MGEFFFGGQKANNGSGHNGGHKQPKLLILHGVLHAKSPCAMVLTASFVLAPETGLCVSVGDNARALHRISASGYQAHTTSPSATTRLVERAINVHRFPDPTFVTTRTPLIPGTG